MVSLNKICVKLSETDNMLAGFAIFLAFCGKNATEMVKKTKFFWSFRFWGHFRQVFNKKHRIPVPETLRDSLLHCLRRLWMF